MKQSKASVFYKLPGKNPIVKKTALVTNELVSIDFNAKNTFYFSPYNNRSKAYQFDLLADMKHFEIIAFSPKNNFKQDSKAEFVQKVQKAVKTMNEQTTLSKVVMARSFSTKIENTFDINAYFVSLCINYPNAFIYAVSSSITGTWIAATPELLLKKEGNTIETIALAGTKLSASNTDWGDKDLDEQNQVAYYIEQLLLKYKFSKLVKTGPYTTTIGHLNHISTRYSFLNKEPILHSFLEELNPTPAVAGLPQKEAISFINDHENLERKFYTGFAGVSNMGQLSLFVNLRCLELFKDSALLYAGCGITAQSNAELEWEETENKLRILMRFLD